MLTLAGVNDENLIELACEDCKYHAKAGGHPVKRVLHRYDMAGNLVGTLTEA